MGNIEQDLDRRKAISDALWDAEQQLHACQARTEQLLEQLRDADRQHRGAVSEAQAWKAEAYRLRTIIGEATKQDAETCKRWLLDALAIGGQ